jgi:hypothetical protein
LKKITDSLLWEIVWYKDYLLDRSGLWPRAFDCTQDIRA